MTEVHKVTSWLGTTFSSTNDSAIQKLQSLPTLHLKDILNLPKAQLVGLIVGAYVLYLATYCIYNLYFHPLRNIPGPWYTRVSPLWYMYTYSGERYPFKVKELHDRYGSVVRTAPDQLSFNTASSWKQIYGHVGGRKQFLKGAFYGNDKDRHVVSETDPEKHGRARRLLSNSFSAKALNEQEDLVQDYVDMWIKQINTHCTKDEKGTEMVQWFNWLTFDIIGDLAFGDPFGCVKNAEQHYWITLVLKQVEANSVLTAMRKISWLKAIRKIVIPSRHKASKKKHLAYSSDKIQRRLNNPEIKRKDILTKLVEETHAGRGLTVGELTMNSSLLIVAGSETTATALSGFAYYTCRNPSAYKNLVEEVRGAFPSYEDITGHATDRLPYLKAVIDESLRMFPPVPIGMPRESPGGGETVDGIYLPEGTEVFTSSWSATHNENNFHQPYDFIPERWIDPACTDKKEASQPFLLGSRVCLGRNLALLELRLSIAKLIWTYDMELKDGNLDWDRDAVCHALWTKPALPILFTRRPGAMVPQIDG